MRETELNVRDLIYPWFVRHGEGRSEIRSMPGVYQLSVEEAVREAETPAKSGVPAVILFGIPAEKDSIGLENFAEDGIVQQAIRAIKKEIPEMVVVTDVCLCEYTDHGHCGLLNTGEHFHTGYSEGYVLNDETLDILAKRNFPYLLREFIPRLTEQFGLPAPIKETLLVAIPRRIFEQARSTAG